MIPKQISSVSFVEDNGIEDQDTITYLSEHSLSKCKQIFAWVHTRSPGENCCEFTSTDMHTQYVLEQYVSKDIIGIIIEIRKKNYIWNAMHLNIFGKQRVEFCGKNYNTPFDQHKWCNCECLYESCRSSIKLLDEVPMGHSKVRLGNFLKEKPNWSLPKEPSDSESKEENPEDEVSCD